MRRRRRRRRRKRRRSKGKVEGLVVFRGEKERWLAEKSEYNNRKVKCMRDKEGETETEHKWRTYRCNRGTD